MILRFYILVSFFAFTIFSSTCCSSDTLLPATGTSELDCVPQVDGSVVCQFHVKNIQESRVALSKWCHSQKDRKICVDGEIQIHIDIDIDSETDTKTETETEFSAKEPHNQDPEQTLVVGKATYVPPFSQHGSRVEAVLRRAPIYDRSTEWSNWYLDLASAHYPTADQNLGNDDVWVQVEFAINAYQQAIQVVEKEINPTTEQVSFLASAYYFLGESYLLDPNLRYLEEAVQAYRESHKLYEKVLILLPPEHRQQTETKFAEACTKLGMALLSLMDPMETTPAWMIAMMDPMHKPHSSRDDKLSQVKELLENAIRIYEKYQHAEMSQGDRNEFQLTYATAMQQAASLAMIQGRFLNAKLYYVRALEIQMRVVTKLSSVEAQPSYTAIADILLSLADTCVQMGNYPCAKKSYQKAMAFHETYFVEVSPIMPVDGGDDGMLELNDAILETTAALKEYRSSVHGGTNKYRRPYSESFAGTSNEEYYFEKDDGYEGDLLSSLGNMYLSLGDPRAISFLEQAMEKYSNSPADQESPAMADLLMNLSMAYYRNRQFQDSQRVHDQALEIYRSLYGDYVNPYTQIDDVMKTMMMQQNMGGGGFHSHHSSWQQGGTKRSSVDDLKKESSSAETKASHPTAILPIDIEAFKQSIQNSTESRQPKDIKEEL